MSDRIPTHPGAILREDVLPTLGLTVDQFATALGVTRQTLHRVMAGTSGVSPALACRLGKALGNGGAFWLAMQSNHDLALAQSVMREIIDAIPTLHPQSAQSDPQSRQS